MCCIQPQANGVADDGPSTSTATNAEGEGEANGEEFDVDDDDDELDMDELNELEASLSKASIQIKEPGVDA